MYLPINPPTIDREFCVALAQPTMPADLYDVMDKQWPGEIDQIGMYGYARWRAADFMRCSLPSVWRAFWEAHLSSGYVRSLLAFWQDELQARYPHILDLDPDKTEIRSHDPKGQLKTSKADFIIEGQFVEHTGFGPEMVVPIHYDHPRTLFFSLWYFRDPQDDSTGGDLTFYRANPFTQFDDRFPTTEVHPGLTVPYRTDQFMLCLNNPKALHGAGPRGHRVWCGPRRHIGISVELPSGPLFGPEMYGK